MNPVPPELLVVEDNDFDVRRIERSLQKLGRPPGFRRARDGIEALDMLRRAAPSDAMAPVVVLLDLNMPRLGGIGFLDELRADPRLQATPVFVLTTSDYEKDVAAAHARMICGYLTKPRTSEEMVRLLQVITDFCDCCLYPV